MPARRGTFGPVCEPPQACGPRLRFEELGQVALQLQEEREVLRAHQIGREEHRRPAVVVAVERGEDAADEKVAPHDHGRSEGRHPGEELLGVCRRVLAAGDLQDADQEEKLLLLILDQEPGRAGQLFPDGIDVSGLREALAPLRGGKGPGALTPAGGLP
jgi:hypothetical protein